MSTRVLVLVAASLCVSASPLCPQAPSPTHPQDAAPGRAESPAPAIPRTPAPAPATGVWSTAGGSSKVATPPIIEASRVDGVAPLSVFFDALDNVADPLKLHEPYFAWNFDDPMSQHPTATGFCAAHVFENPGDYHVFLLIANGDNSFESTSIRIHVRPYVGPTIYVSSSTGNDANDGRTPATALRTFDKAVAVTLAVIPTNGQPTPMRVLFARGDSFTTAVGCALGLNRNGDPLIFGTYGSGPKPLITNTGAAPLFSGNWHVVGLRFMDLELSGLFDFNSGTGWQQPLMVFHEGYDRLCLRVTFHNAESGYIETSLELDIRYDISLFDCDIYDMYNTCAYVGGRGLALVGNRMEHVYDSHVCRVWMAERGFISENDFLDPSVKSGTGRQALKMHAPAGDVLFTRNVVINDNVFRGATWPVAFAPQNATSHERVENILFERNVVLPDVLSPTLTQSCVIVYAQNVTIRDSVFVGGPREHDLSIVQVMDFPQTNLPAPQHIRLHANTAIHLSSLSWLWITLLDVNNPGAGDFEVADNIVYAPSGGSGNGFPCSLVHLNYGARLSELTAHHNLVWTPGTSTHIWNNGTPITLQAWQNMGQGAGSKRVDPRFVNGPQWDIRLMPSSPAWQSGAPLPGLRDDLLGRPRDLPGMRPSMGALQ